MSSAPLIDCHFHVWHRDQPLAPTAWHRPPGDATVEALLETHDAHGVALGVVAAASIHGDYNDYVRRCLRAHPRLRGTAILPPETGLDTLEAMAADGFVGVRLMWSQSDTVPDIDTAPYRLFLRRLRDLGWHIHLVDRPERYAATIARIEDAGVPLVIDHMGHMHAGDGPDSAAFRAILEAVRRGGTWVKLSARFRQTPPEKGERLAAALLDTGRIDRMLWGSDWPFAGLEGQISYADVLRDFARVVPDAGVRHEIDRTGLRFYFGA